MNLNDDKFVLGGHEFKTFNRRERGLINEQRR